MANMNDQNDRDKNKSGQNQSNQGGKDDANRERNPDGTFKDDNDQSKDKDERR